MSDFIKIQGVGVSQVAASAPEAAPIGKPAAPVTVAAADHVGGAVPKLGAEGAKLSALDAPKAGGVAIRGSSRVADANDAIWGAAMGLLWADAISH